MELTLNEPSCFENDADISSSSESSLEKDESEETVYNKTYQIEESISRYKTIEEIVNSRRPNYHLSYKWDNFLHKLSIEFEKCSTSRDFRLIERKYANAIKAAKQNKLHILKLHFMYHQTKSSYMLGQDAIAIKRKDKLIKYQEEHCIDDPLARLLCHQLQCFYHMSRNPFEFSTFEYLQNMCAQLGMLKFGFETHILQFSIGRVLVELLKIPKEIMQIFKNLIIEATEKFQHFNHFCKDTVSLTSLKALSH